MSTKNIMIVGVGGQGAILVSKVLTKGLIIKNYNIHKLSP